MPAASDPTATCFARLTDDLLCIGNAAIERHWRVRDGVLSAIALTDRASGRAWLRENAKAGSVPPATPPAGARASRLTLRRGRAGPVEAPSLIATLECGADDAAVIWEFQIFPDLPAIACRLLRWPSGTAAVVAHRDEAASGIERDPVPAAGHAEAADLCERLLLTCHHAEVHGAHLADQTDKRDNLATPYTLRVSPCEPLRLTGCVFALEDPLSGDGLVLLKHAALPHARPVPCACDLHATYAEGRPAAELSGHGAAPGGAGTAWSVGCYRGGALGRTTLLHAIQRCQHTYDPARDGRLISNTWGDRNRDGRMCAAFMAREIAAGAALGVDAVQLDDGWQRGVTQNSVRSAQGGVWSGFWAADPQFWDAHPQRFPGGLAPTAAQARAAGIAMGLWFAPDSSDDFRNWRRDAEAVLGFFRVHDVRLVKIDGVKALSRTGEENLLRFFDAVLEGSGGAVAFDLDVTAEVRPGWFGAMRAGPIFVENRYTDWHRWWPHATLRNLWQLAHWIDPLRLRVEFLNQRRNAAQYAGDPLAPLACPPDYVFASIMVASPLAWFEVSELAEEDAACLRPLIALWKQHRAALHGGTILPIGACPSGAARTGFCSLGHGSAYVIALRERCAQATARWELPLPSGTWRAEVLAGDGEATLDGLIINLRWARELSYLVVRLSRST